MGNPKHHRTPVGRVAHPNMLLPILRTPHKDMASKGQISKHMAKGTQRKDLHHLLDKAILRQRTYSLHKPLVAVTPAPPLLLDNLARLSTPHQ